MKSITNYQSIRTPEDEEYEERVKACYQELLDIYADDIEEQGLKPHNKAALMQRARKMARRR